MLRKIIVINDHGFISGGAAQVAISSLNELARKGYDVTFVSSVGPVSSEIDERYINIINFGFHDLVMNPSKASAALRGIWDSRTARGLGALLDACQLNNTIIHVHTWSKSLSSSVVRECCIRGFKVICTLHDYFSICPNGGLYNYQTKEACLLPPMSRACVLSKCDSRSYMHKIWRVTRQLAQRHMGKIPDGIKHFITVSDFSESLIKPYLSADAHFYRVTNPINIKKLQPFDPGTTNTFTFVGRLSPEKGALLFAQAAKKAGVAACFVGSGDEEQIINKVNPEAILLGWQDQSGVIGALSRSRALVLPSRWYETQGLVVQEAAALGVPAIVSDGCAARDSIFDKINGMLFRNGDLDDLANKLDALNTAPKLARKLGRKAYNLYWQNPCTLERHVDELLECYNSVMSQN